MDLDKEQFEKFIKENDVCVIDFWAPWCGPCLALSPNLEAACEAEKVPLGKVNVDENRELAVKYGVMSIPCVIRFEKGEEADRFIGNVPNDRIGGFLG